MPTTGMTRPVSQPRHRQIPGAPPPLNTMTVPVPPSQPQPAQRPAASGQPRFAPPQPVGQVDPSDPTTWPHPGAIEFTS